MCFKNFRMVHFVEAKIDISTQNRICASKRTQWRSHEHVPKRFRTNGMRSMARHKSKECPLKSKSTN